jgi:peptidyl-prolyl cis-trans isomerase C
MTRALAIVALVACGQKSAEGPRSRPIEEPYAGAWSPRPTPAAEIVAEVNGEAIWDVDLAAYARDQRLTPREALEELIALELLAQEARRRGLAEDPEVVQVRRRERVRRFVDLFAAESDDPAEIPAADVDRVWARRDVQAALNHGPIHDTGYVRVRAARKAPAAEVEAARAVAEELRAHLVAARPASYAEFQRLAAERHQALTGKKLALEKSFPIEATTAADEGFKAAALALARPGQISPVTRTAWGWDILYLVEIVPARATTREQADAELRRRLHDDWRKHAFRRWLEATVAPARVSRHDENLERVDVDSTFGLP